MTEPPGGIHRVDIVAGLAYLSSGVLGTLAVTVGDAWPEHAKQVIATAGVLSLTAGLLTRMFANPTGKPATAIVAGAPIVSPPPNPEVPKP